LVLNRLDGFELLECIARAPDPAEVRSPQIPGARTKFDVTALIERRDNILGEQCLPSLTLAVGPANNCRRRQRQPVSPESFVTNSPAPQSFVGRKFKKLLKKL
jgi:hypothetical protein